MKPLIFPITYKCNLSCKFCPTKDSRPEPYIEKCLELIKGSSSEWVLITGGEPLIVKNIESICKTIKSYGKKIGLTTNGTIDNQHIPEFVDRLGVSIDGDRDYHNLYRQNSFDKATAFLKSMVGRVETVLMFTLFSENAYCVQKIETIARLIGVDSLQIETGIK